MPKFNEYDPAPNAVYLLADHLDASLALGEDMGALTYVVPDMAHAAGAEAIDAALAARERFVAQLRALELALVGRLMQARVQAAALARVDVRFKPIVSLFESGTTALVDAVAELGDRSRSDFDGSDAISYLRGAGFIAEDAATLPVAVELRAGDNFRLVQRIELGVLLDLVATFLDALELHYDLFQAAGRGDELAGPAAHYGVLKDKLVPPVG